MSAAREAVISFSFVIVGAICLSSFINDSWIVSDFPFGSVAPSPTGGNFPQFANRLSFGLREICAQVGDDRKCFAYTEYDFAVIFTGYVILLAAFLLTFGALLYCVIVIQKTCSISALNDQRRKWLELGARVCGAAAFLCLCVTAIVVPAAFGSPAAGGMRYMLANGSSLSIGYYLFIGSLLLALLPNVLPLCRWCNNR